MDKETMLRLLKERKDKLKKLLQGKVILLERVQVNVNNPAIARVVIEIPKYVEMPVDINSFYNSKLNSKIDSYVEFKKTSPRSYSIEVQSNKYMYSWLEEFIKSFVNKYSSLGYTVYVKGEWHKFD